MTAKPSQAKPSQAKPSQLDIRELVVAYVKDRDPYGKTVKIDVDRKTITYGNGIKVWQTPKFETEGFIRAYLVAKLVFDLGYPPSEMEIERKLDVDVGRQKKKSEASGVVSGRNDLLLFQAEKNKAGKTTRSLFLGIECKASEKELTKSLDADANGQLWGIPKATTIEEDVGKRVKYLCLFALDAGGSSIEEHVIIVDYKKFETFDKWNKSSRPLFSIIPPNYGIPSEKVYAKVEKETPGADGAVRVPLNKNLDLAAFVKLRSKLHNRLWAGSSADDNAIFYQLVKLFLVKIFDEMTTHGGKDYGVQVLTRYGIEETASDLFARIDLFYNEACSKLLNYDSKTISNFPLMVQGMTEQKLKVAVQALQGVSITSNEGVAAGHDFLGAFFEGILSNQDFFKQSKGCFFTHQNIVRFIVSALEIDKEAKKTLTENLTRPRLPSIIDPSCGSGTFLIEAMKFLTASLRRNRPSLLGSDYLTTFLEQNLDVKSKPNIWAKDCLYGIETRPELGLAAKVNMILHGDGNMNVFIQDALHLLGHENFKKVRGNAHETNKGDIGLLSIVEKSEVYPKPVNEQFDFVITNPPFSLETAGLDSKSTHKDSFIHHNKTNSENLFIERHWQLLRPKGRLAAVLPESVFDTSENIYIRLFIYKHFWVDGVVSLPTDAFAPFTTTKTSILLATKKIDTEIEAWDKTWQIAAEEYTHLRKSVIAQIILDNDRLLNGSNGLLSMCVEFGITFEPDSPVLDKSILTENLKAALEAAIASETDEEHQKVLSISLANIVAFADGDKLREAGKQILPPKTSKDKKSQISGGDAVEVLRRLLRRFFPVGASNVVEICDRAYDELLMALRLDWDGGDAKAKSYANVWWCFAETVKNQMRPTFYAEVENVGYKRTKRGESVRQNDLYSTLPGGDEFPFLNLENPATVLDHFLSFKRKNKID